MPRQMRPTPSKPPANLCHRHLDRDLRPTHQTPPIKGAYHFESVAMDRTSTASNLMGTCHLTHPEPKSMPVSNLSADTHNRLIADILTRYRALMMLATNQAEGGRNNANPETVSVTGISMQTEFDGLVHLPRQRPLHRRS